LAGAGGAAAFLAAKVGVEMAAAIVTTDAASTHLATNFIMEPLPNLNPVGKRSHKKGRFTRRAPCPAACGQQDSEAGLPFFEPPPASIRGLGYAKNAPAKTSAGTSIWNPIGTEESPL
jgi:hypothetical protein